MLKGKNSNELYILNQRKKGGCFGRCGPLLKPVQVPVPVAAVSVALVGAFLFILLPFYLKGRKITYLKILK